MKWLPFDVDRSMSSIGSEEVIESLLGFPPAAVNMGIDQVTDLIERITEIKQVGVKHSLFGETHKEDVYTISEGAQAIGLQGLIIDSLSVLTYQTKLKLMADHNVRDMDLQLWGKLGSSVMRFIHRISRLQAPVIMTSHIRRDKDENGGPIELPAIEGGAREQVARFFDVVVYAYVKASRKQGPSYIWQIRPDGRRIQAKSRLAYPSETGIIDPDVAEIVRFYQENGVPNPKILILGDTGSGKTTSLATLATLTDKTVNA